MADILYLTPEGAPHVFRPPVSATVGNDTLPDRRGYNFDGCSPGLLISKAIVKDHRIVFPGGGSYQLLVLPLIETMTPELLNKIEWLVRDGANVAGIPPKKSPSLVNFPECDQTVTATALKMWKSFDLPGNQQTITYGSGRIFWGSGFMVNDSTRPYPTYDVTSGLLKQMNVTEDFTSGGPVRYAHRILPGMEIYFVANKSNNVIITNCDFRSDHGTPELWNPLTGEIRKLENFTRLGGHTGIEIQFDAHQSYFVVFDTKNKDSGSKNNVKNFPDKNILKTLDGSWELTFDPNHGGPGEVVFDQLTDWTSRPEEGIKYYSGTVVYEKKFSISREMLAQGHSLFINLGEVNCMAQVRLNGTDVGTLWTAPWNLDITKAVREGDNKLEISVVNLWPNRLIGDEKYPFDGISKGKWPDWLLENSPRNSKRSTFATYSFYKKDAPLYKSGLVGPVSILAEE